MIGGYLKYYLNVSIDLINRSEDREGEKNRTRKR